MARADLLISLIKATSKGDQVAVCRAIDGIIAEEREKKHPVFAERLASIVRENGETAHRPSLVLNNGVEQLLCFFSPRSVQLFGISAQCLPVFCLDVIKYATIYRFPTTDSLSP